MNARLLIPVLLACATTASAQTVRIDVFTLFHPAELKLSPAQGSTVLVSAGGRHVLLNNERDHCSVLVRLEQGQLLLNNTPVRSIRAASRSGEAVDFMLAVPGRIMRRYHGVLNITAAQHELRPAVTMDIETAVASVVAAEVAPSMPLEAMKAQAVAARSFFRAGGRHGEDEFCDTTHCQFLREPPAPSAPASIATRDTRGLILTWHGKPLAAMYSSRCGGKTKTLQEIGSPVRGYPYFEVECPYCRRHPYAWTRALNPAGADALSRSAEHQRLLMDRTQGWSAIPSNSYQVSTGARGVTLHGQGQGHSLGLCQYGAAGMAADGASFNEILRHYYPETELTSIPEQSEP
jgi:stage II sporulation protein D